MARDVESQVSMLLPSQLEAADSRLSSLLTKMDKVQEKTAPHSAEADAKVLESKYLI